MIVGNLGKIYDPNRALFRSVKVAADATLLVSDPNAEIRLFDFYGNPVPSKAGKIQVPLNGLGFFLRTDGSAGSFSRLLTALRQARMQGYDPVQIVAHDFTAPVGAHPQLRITLTNVLNRPITGRVKAAVDGLALTAELQTIHLQPNQTQEVIFKVGSGSPAPSNIYPTVVEVDAGQDGKAVHREALHVNFIARRSITVDGDLSDWDGILPQVLPDVAINANLTEESWLPFKSFAKTANEGLATSYLAYDRDNFYFAAKIADSTPDPGMVRFSQRDDDSYFYPEQSTGPDGAQMSWPKGVRNYSYRKNFDIPSGSGEHDNVQIAFNVLDKKPWFSHPPGVMPKFITYWDTDYEYALNPVAEQYGGGTEIWRLQAPGIPRKHFFPRQPKSPIDGGPVTTGKLVVRREGNTRIVEAAIPWSEMPEVHKRLLAGEKIKFSCRVGDNKGPAHELAAGRSVSKLNSVTFHDDWQDHWANELEFGFQKAAIAAH